MDKWPEGTTPNISIITLAILILTSTPFRHASIRNLDGLTVHYRSHKVVEESQHCSFVLLADFDIDRGAQLTYQFPQPLGTDEGYVAIRSPRTSGS